MTDFNIKEDRRLQRYVKELQDDFIVWSAPYKVVLDITRSPMWEDDGSDFWDMTFTEEGYDWVNENLPDKGWDTQQFEWGAAYAAFKDPDKALLFKLRWL